MLTSEASLNTIRHALKTLGKLDTIFVVDTIHDRAMQSSISAPEADTHSRPPHVVAHARRRPQGLLRLLHKSRGETFEIGDINRCRQFQPGFLLLR